MTQKKTQLLGATALAVLAAGCPGPAAAQSWWVQPAAYAAPPAPGGGLSVVTAQATLPTQNVSTPPHLADTPPAPQATPQPDPSKPSPSESPTTTAVPVTTDLPGVLTREGVLVVEPSVQFQHSSMNNFVAGGVAILDTVLVGNIQATQSSQDAVTAAVGLRYGVTNRLEVEARFPYMWRSDNTVNTIVSTNTPQSTTNLQNYALGDIEAAIHYQINDGRGQWPIFVANVRVKSNTGLGPFDVNRDNAGVETQLPTGSGFWAVEPSVTLVAPSDPAVFYANLGYLYSFSSSENKSIGGQYLNSVDPGGAVRIGMGMGLALNDKVALSLGYQHDFISETTFHFSNGNFTAPSLSVGTLNIGVNWQIDQTTALNINVGVGVTRDAPDVSLMARLPISIKMLE